jgi:PTS system nitrogen regulatory IIA component
MSIKNLLSADFIIHDLKVGSKKRVMDHISAIISDGVDNTDYDTIFSGLIERERLGSTGIGEGVAIPHCRLDDIEDAVGVFFKLSQAVDFDAIDKQPVDLIFALVVPSNSCDEHLNTLAQLAEMFSQEDNRNRLRKCTNAEELYQMLLKQSDQ